jgi:hypothetical protein
MAEVTTKSRAGVKSPSVRRPGIPAIRFTGVVERGARLSDGVLTSLETGERAAIEAVGQFVITIEDALPEEVAGTSEVAKKITQSGFDMADRLVHTSHDVLRNVIDTSAKSLRSHDWAERHAA